jgi:small subunit ribosomal protein S3Ae
MSIKAKKKRGRGKTIDTWKSKQWYEVYAPATFKNEYLGQIPSGDPENLTGRTLSVLLYDLTKNFKHTTIKLKFKITETVGLRCNSVFWGYELTRDFIRSLIHRGSSRIDGIFNFSTADGVIYRVSTFVVTRRRAKQSQKKTIRKIIYQVLEQFAANLTHEKFIQGIVYGKFAVNIQKIVKTIYPLRECQIRKVKVLTVPEGITDNIILDDDQVFDEITLEMKKHGKTVKAMKGHPKRGRMEETISEEVADSESKE